MAEKATPSELMVAALEVSAPFLMASAIKLSRGSSREFVEDAMQETFLKAWERQSQFEGRSEPNTWLYRMLANNIKDLRAKDEVFYRRHVLGIDTEFNGSIGSAGEDPATVVMREESQSALVAELELLAPGQRGAVLMHVLGFNHAEAAEQMGTTVGNSKSQLARGLATLRRHREAA